MMIRCGSIFVCCLLIIVNHSVDVTAECDITKCGVPKHYREIGCEPVKYAADDVEKCCPIEYNCEEIAKQDGAKCHYQGKSYSNGERIPDDIHCRASCRCDDGNIECAHIECPSEFDPPAPHCVQQRSEKECCSTNVICDEAVIATLPVCYLNGRKYHGGEKMFPKERCFSCFCDEKFDNATAVSQNPSCSEVNCAIDVNYLPRIRSGCAPIYFGEPTCCPIGIKCPNAEDKAVPTGRQSADLDDSAQCKFGDLRLNQGDRVTDSDKCLDCKCELPPMITCVKQRNC